MTRKQWIIERRRGDDVTYLGTTGSAFTANPWVADITKATRFTSRDRAHGVILGHALAWPGEYRYVSAPSKKGGAHVRS